MIDQNASATFAAVILVCLNAAACALEEGREDDVGLQVQGVISGRNYGTYCEESYQNGWQVTLPGTWDTCNNFNSRMNLLAPRSFYYNLHGAAWHFDNSGDQENGGGLDGVDLVFVSTHGGAWTSPDRAALAMWDQNSVSISTDYRLGDENKGLSIFAMHACETLKFSGLNNRWTSAFDGGLRIAVGSHDKIFFSSSSTGNGSRFADNMNAGQSIRDAWKNALSGTSLDQDAAVVPTGTNSTNCTSRLDGINWSNLTTFARLFDTAWQSICQREWANL